MSPLTTQVGGVEILMQKRLTDVIVIFSTRKIDFADLTTEFVARVLVEDENIKRRIEEAFRIRYNGVRYWERQQPPETSDIELLYNGEVMLRISLKTTTKGRRITNQLRELIRTLRPEEIGALAFPAKIVQKDDGEEIRLVLTVTTYETATTLGAVGLEEEIARKMREKKQRENLKEVMGINLDEVGIIQSIALSIQSREKAEEAAKEAKEAREKAEEIVKLLEKVIELMKRQNPKET